MATKTKQTKQAIAKAKQWLAEQGGDDISSLNKPIYPYCLGQAFFTRRELALIIKAAETAEKRMKA